MNLNVSGIIQVIMAAVAAFIEIWNTIHGKPVTPESVVLTAGVAASGAAHLTKQTLK